MPGVDGVHELQTFSCHSFVALEAFQAGPRMIDCRPTRTHRGVRQLANFHLSDCELEGLPTSSAMSRLFREDHDAGARRPDGRQDELAGLVVHRYLKSVAKR